VEVHAYAGRLATWSLDVDPAAFQRMVDAPDDGIRISGSLTVGDVEYATALRIHGGTSRAFPKKSLRFDLAPGLALPSGRNHLVLRAEWNDKTMVRNHLGYTLFRDATWLPTPDTEPVHFRINDRYYGLMWSVERIDGDFLSSRGLGDGNLYEGEPEDEFFSLDTFSVLDDPADYRLVYDHKKGPDDVELIRLIEEVLTADEDAIFASLHEVVNLDAYLVYLATMATIQNQDHVKKNFYFHRDPSAADDRWRFYPWDVDLSHGHLWTEEASTTDERMFTDGSAHHGRCPGFCSVLMTRVWGVPALQERYEAMVRRIVDVYFTEEATAARIDRFLCRAEPDLLADVRKRATGDEYAQRLEELFEFTRARREVLAREPLP
jgi:hypothetical protein